MKKVRRSIVISNEYDVDMLALRLVDNLSHKDLIDFIMEIDELMEDWDFTQKLYSRIHEELAKRND